MKKLILFFCFAFLAITVKSEQPFFILTMNGLVDKNDNSKNYVVINVSGKSQKELYDLVNVKLNSFYISSNFTQSKVENKSIQISGVSRTVINTKAFGKIIPTYNLEHVINLEFRDNMIKFTPLDFRIFGNFSRNSEVYLVNGFLAPNIFHNNGKVRMLATKESLENYYNNYVKMIYKAVNDSTEEKW